MRKLMASTLAAGLLVGGVGAGVALASSSHAGRAAKVTAVHHDSSADRASVDRHSADHSHSHSDRSSLDR